jgi:regulator of replication initiation timing
MNDDIETMTKQIDQSYNYLHDMCMRLIEEKCKLQVEVNNLKHQLAMARVDMLGKEHDEC